MADRSAQLDSSISCADEMHLRPIFRPRARIRKCVGCANFRRGIRRFSWRTIHKMAFQARKQKKGRFEVVGLGTFIEQKVAAWAKKLPFGKSAASAPAAKKVVK